MNVILLILGMLFSGIIFAADIAFGLGAISLFYVIFLLTVFWFTRKNLYIISAMISSIVLTIHGWLFQSRETVTSLDVGGFRADLDYESLFRVIAILLIMFIGAILFKAKRKNDELQELNQTLDLRILAKTSTAETRAKRLEGQIRALKGIREESTTSAISRLDHVIEQLRVLNEEEDG